MLLKYVFCHKHKGSGNLISGEIPDKEIYEDYSFSCGVCAVADPQPVPTIITLDDSSLEAFHKTIGYSSIMSYVAGELEDQNHHSMVDLPDKLLKEVRHHMSMDVDDSFFFACAVYRAFLIRYVPD